MIHSRNENNVTIALSLTEPPIEEQIKAKKGTMRREEKKKFKRIIKCSEQEHEVSLYSQR